jgi:hypothetical protein
MAVQRESKFEQSYIPPVTCKCGGNTHIVRRISHPMESAAGLEVLTFQCYECRELIVTTVNR